MASRRKKLRLLETTNNVESIKRMFLNSFPNYEKEAE